MAKTERISWLSRRLDHWSRRRSPPGPEAVLNRKNILILPTSQGLLLLLAALVIFIAAVNYENSLAFGLAFFMVSLFVVSMLNSFQNLNGLRLRGLPTAPVFKGEEAAFQVLVCRKANRRHEALELYFRGSAVSTVGLIAYGEEPVTVFTPAAERGLYAAPALLIRSRFPTGLFTAWSVVHLQMQCLVYPRPVAIPMEQVFKADSASAEGNLVRAGTNDFYGFRSFTPGDSLRQVAWKNVARGQGMLVKQFVDAVDARVVLDWDLFFGFPLEERLSRLCHCVLKLAESQAAYGLRLPGVEIAPDTGKPHRLRTLQALALYGVAEPWQSAAAREA